MTGKSGARRAAARRRAATSGRRASTTRSLPRRLASYNASSADENSEAESPPSASAATPAEHVTRSPSREAQLAQPGDDACGGCRGRALVAADEQHELLAAEARGDVGVARGVAHDLTGLPEDIVADGVTVAVVDLLEVVQVEHHERDLAAVALHAAQLDLERLVEELRPVQARQRIDQRAALESAPVALREGRRDRSCAGGGQQRDAQRERHGQRGRQRREQEPGGPGSRRQHDSGSEQDGRQRGDDECRQGAAQRQEECGGKGEPVAAQPSLEHAVVIAARSDAE